LPRQDRAPGDGPRQGMRARVLVRRWSLPNPPSPSSHPKNRPHFRFTLESILSRVLFLYVFIHCLADDDVSSSSNRFRRFGKFGLGRSDPAPFCTSVWWLTYLSIGMRFAS
jgi:hypothetical protein